MPICIPNNTQPPPRRKSVQSEKRLLLNSLQVEMDKKKSSMTLVDIGCTGLCKAVFPECLYHLTSFDVLSVVSVLRKRRLSFLLVVAQSSVSKHDSKFDSVISHLSMTVSPSGMDPQQIPGIINPGAFLLK